MRPPKLSSRLASLASLLFLLSACEPSVDGFANPGWVLLRQLEWLQFQLQRFQLQRQLGQLRIQR